MALGQLRERVFVPRSRKRVKQALIGIDIHHRVPSAQTRLGSIRASRSILTREAGEVHKFSSYVAIVDKLSIVSTA
jgi:hypothetical protein